MDAEQLPNIYDPTFDEERDHPGYVARRARIGYQLATARLGLSLWELPAGQAAYPYHFHLAEEERQVFAGERRPRGGGVRLLFREADAVDYYDGAQPPPGEPA